MSIFNSVRMRKPRKNKFDLGHERKFSLKMGELVPILVQDVVPGDKFRVSTEVMLRMAPMLAPIMHRVNVFTHYFFVPNRLVWNEFEDFITGGPDGTLEPVSPFMYISEDSIGNDIFRKGGLCDYMGLPVFANDHEFHGQIKFSALPFRAYQMIWNEYYRDQNLTTPIEFSKDSGQVDLNDYFDLTDIRRRAWEKDYFTSALPWAQRGAEVKMPIVGTTQINYMDATRVERNSGGDPVEGPMDISEDPGDNFFKTYDDSGNPVQVKNLESVELNGAETTINDLRRSIRLQEWLEKNARGGARYIEQILSHFGVRSSDARLQRPEYLGGGRQPIVISEVLNTAGVPESLPQGNMAGHGIAAGKSNQFSRFFEEHGYVIGIMSVLPKTAYQQGIPRHFSRESKFDYYWPEFAHIGEQEIKNKELYVNGANGEEPEAVFGYTPRYAEYKHMQSSVHGEFRDTLSYWHMGRIFSSTPGLSDTFVEADPTTRIFAVEGEEQMYCQLYNNVDAIRPMPYFGTPTL